MQLKKLFQLLVVGGATIGLSACPGSNDSAKGGSGSGGGTGQSLKTSDGGAGGGTGGGAPRGW